MGFFRSLDPKLVSTVLAFAAARALSALAINADPELELIVSGVIAAIVGYLYPNEGTVLRTGQEDGNANPDAGVHKPSDA